MIFLIMENLFARGKITTNWLAVPIGLTMGATWLSLAGYAVYTYVKPESKRQR